MKELLAATPLPIFRGVIWITGYSAAGKTTIGRKVEAMLKADGLNTIFLDGDDLRSIFGNHWGYQREQRVELAKIYFRLCSHLAAHGYTVVISAVAMYDEIADWVRSNIPRSVQIYLKVPEAVRQCRDTETKKKVYASKDNLKALYDEPRSPNIVIDNSGAATPESVAKEIVDFYLKASKPNRDMGRTSHWNAFYGKAKIPTNPSPFAEHVASRLNERARIIEIGCGNGRDSAYFALQGHNVTAIDMSEAAITACKEHHHGLSINYLVGTITQNREKFNEIFDVAYSRFVFHAMPLEEEIEVLAAVAGVLRPGGSFYIECRSINDPMARIGEVISPTERLHGHYRRFIVLDELRSRLQQAGFGIVDCTESNGLAVFADEDPVVIRISARGGNS